MVDLVWKTAVRIVREKAPEKPSIHTLCGECIDAIIRYSAYKKSLDNLTAVMIAFESFEKAIFGEVFNDQPIL